MTLVERVGHDEVWGRDLFVMSIPKSEDLPRELSVSTARFVCLIAWDAQAAGTEQISAVARRLLDGGAVYVCAWGPDCERVHDIIDEQHVGLVPKSTVRSVVMTTWHDDESLEETLGFVLTAAIPDEAYAEECGSTLGISIGSSQWAAEIRRAFSRPREFVAQWTAESG